MQSALPLLLGIILAGQPLEERFPSPPGFNRVAVESGSFGAFLRTLPLLPPGTPVRSYAGDTIAAPAAAVAALDVGKNDLQQCADSAIRLYAEWRFASGRVEELSFHATSGDPLPWNRWRRGERPSVVGQHVRWTQRAPPDDSAASFRAWLDAVFTWAGSRSLARDTIPVAGPLRPGDLLVAPGSPGHVLVVLDVAERSPSLPGGTPELRLLVGQGYMPAQSFHVVDTGQGAWLVPAPDGSVSVPTWPSPFALSSARRFVGP